MTYNVMSNLPEVVNWQVFNTDFDGYAMICLTEEAPLL